MIRFERISTMLKANRENLYVILFFTLFGYFYLGANLFAHQIVAPMDLLLHYPGWSNTEIKIASFNFERSDIIDSIIPQWNFARTALLQGIVPLWDPYTAGGTPNISLLSRSLFSPSFLVFLLFGGGLGFSLSLLVKFVIGSVGAYKLCRTEFGILPSVFGGVTFMMCGFNASWLMWSHVTTSIWIPWLLWGLIQLYREKTKVRFIQVAIFAALLIFGGFPFVTFGGFLVGGLFCIWLVYGQNDKNDWSGKIRSLFYAFAAIGSGVVLTSVQILPFIEYTRQMDISWRNGGSIFTLKDLDILWSPFKYIHKFGDNIVPQVEKCGYVGIITILLAIIAVFSVIYYRRNKFTPLSPLFWGAITLAAAIPVFNIAPISKVIYEMPIFNSNSNTRLLVFLALSFSILGAYGLQIIFESIKKKRGTRENIKKYGVYSIIFMLIIIQVIDMSSVSISQNAVVPDEAFYPDTQSIRYVQQNIKPGQSVIATSAFLVSGTITFYNIPEWFAHTYHKESEKKVLGMLVKNSWKTPTAAIFDLNQIDFDSPLNDKLAVRYILTSNSPTPIGTDNNWTIFSREKGITIFENNDCPNGAYIVDNSGEIDRSLQDNIAIQEFSPNYRKYSITSPHSGTFVTTVRYWPGWQAYVNGKPVQIEPYLEILQSVPIFEGDSTVEFVYVPSVFYCGLLISIIWGIFLWLLPEKFFSWKTGGQS